jgi:pimeloyl-ACP methyl ester carboxylesterase
MRFHESTGQNVITFENMDQLKRLLYFVYYTKPPPAPSFLLNAMIEKGKEDKFLHDKIYDVIRKGESNLAERLRAAGCSIPVLLMWGDSDRVLHVGGATELAEVLPQAKVVIMKDMGHCPMLERPLETAQIFVEFINSIPKASVLIQ